MQLCGYGRWIFGFASMQVCGYAARRLTDRACGFVVSMVRCFVMGCSHILCRSA